MRINREQILGPIASVIWVMDYDEALAVANDMQASAPRRSSTPGIFKPTRKVPHPLTAAAREFISLARSGHYAQRISRNVDVLCDLAGIDKPRFKAHGA
jgi:hypothetical protein